MGGVDLRVPLSEHRHDIYSYKADCEPVSGGGVLSRSVGFKTVMGTGGNRSGGDTGAVTGDRVGKGLVGVDNRGVRGRDGKLRQRIL